ncbi:leucyl aminopeptidase [Rhodoligotrophos appendicifer]|uniref:leucyl aminopeptidase family protein n=1 Tax=Rhodoligotrophos appendicifer TaxID=987056 RepID=UPI001FE4F9AD|nr:leucyl aminopeptidase family protein [Rhodoligotrophos appendicifer]
MTDFDKLLLGADMSGSAIPIWTVTKETAAETVNELSPLQAAWAAAQGFDGGAGKLVLIPNDQGQIGVVLYGLGAAKNNDDAFAGGKLSSLLPEGVYRFAGTMTSARLAALGWLLEAYRFDAYKKLTPSRAALVTPEGVDREEILSQARAVALARDLINTPSNDMGPSELEAAARTLSESHGAVISVITDQSELEHDFPMVHAVGRASERLPRLIDFTWGPASGPKVTLVGKGVCFDTGGLDLKPASNMLMMKKDMGGAANVLALASMIMDAKLQLRLRVLIPAVENSVSGSAFRPGDILQSRKGLTVEIGNTDAEGRLVLADALSLADEEEPELIIDMSTLTGAARVALGPDLPAFFTSDEALSQELSDHATAENDPVWRLPLWRPYASWLDSKVADMNNVSDGGFAGAITAALFLKKFVDPQHSYIHFDIFGWTQKPKPGRPVGGEAQAIRALFAVLKNRYGR